jgi:pimeloyl-ACP methyl ester carboxylesterase
MGYVDVAGLQTWHEVSGAGDAVVLLHGAFAGALSWSAQTSALVDAGFRVYVPERRGHAHTPDVDGPLTYAVMAADTVAYLDEIVQAPAHLIGWSDGAVVGLLVAMQRPDLVARLVLIGQYYNSGGRASGHLIDTLTSRDESMLGFLRAGYDPYSPDGPEHFEVVYEKTVAMVQSEPELTLTSFSAVTAPTLVLQGDRDLVSVAHSLDVAAAVADGRVAVLPGTHALPAESPAVVNPLLVQFLRGGPKEMFGS